MYTAHTTEQLVEHFADTFYEDHTGCDNYNTRPRFYVGKTLIETANGLTRRVEPVYVSGVPYHETYNDGRHTVTTTCDVEQIQQSLDWAPVGAIILCPCDFTYPDQQPEVLVKTGKHEWQQTYRFEQYGFRLVDNTLRPNTREFVSIVTRWHNTNYAHSSYSYCTVLANGKNILDLIRHFESHSKIESIRFMTNAWNEIPVWAKQAEDYLVVSEPA